MRRAHVVALLEFTFELIDIQIKKYAGLAGDGAGPDAGMNASLVHAEVQELFHFAETLKTAIEHSETPSLDKHAFELIYSQIRFYLDQEYLRGYVSWLIDENHIHTPLVERVSKQRAELTQLAELADIRTQFSPIALTPTQKQCEHDSHEIAFKILRLAIDLKQNPEMEFDSDLPKHAIPILRKHARPGARYHQPPLWDAIQFLHERSQGFLLLSKMERSTNALTKDAAKSEVKKHRSRFDELLGQFKNIEPTSRLFLPDHEWYTISLTPPPKKDSSPGVNYPRLFMLLGTAAAIAIAALILYLTHQDDKPANRVEFK